MFNSLRSRLIFFYIIVVLLTLLVAGGGLLLLLQDYQQGIITQRLEAALGPAVATVEASLRQGRTPEQVVGDMQDQIDQSWLVLLVDDQGVIIADSQRALAGRTQPRASSQQNTGIRRFITGVQRIAGRPLVYAATPVLRPGQAREFLVLATIERPLVGALQDLAGPLLIARAIALIAAIVFALLLANSMSGPIGRLTRATEGVARGNFEERIPAEGSDEVARLAVSFNAMMSAVGTLQEAQKDFVANVSHELKTPLTSI